jgi:hypothetical protein
VIVPSWAEHDQFPAATVAPDELNTLTLMVVMP